MFFEKNYNFKIFRTYCATKVYLNFGHLKKISYLSLSTDYTCLIFWKWYYFHSKAQFFYMLYLLNVATLEHKCKINVATFGQIGPVWHVEKHGLTRKHVSSHVIELIVECQVNTKSGQFEPARHDYSNVAEEEIAKQFPTERREMIFCAIPMTENLPFFCIWCQKICGFGLGCLLKTTFFFQ
jgi:hypothetical protein